MSVRNLLSVIFAIILNNTVLCQPVFDHGQLQVINGRLKDQQGKNVMLKGVSLGWHNWWPRFYDPLTVRTLASDWNCSVIRIAVGVEPEGAYLENPDKAMETIIPVIEEAINENIYIIIDWHSHDIHSEAAKDFFITIAEKYGTYPHIIYEIFNEPDYESWQQIKGYSSVIIKAIRNIDPDNIILVGTPAWAQEVNMAANDPLDGFNNIMYSLHFYAASHKKELRNKLRIASAKKLPVFVTECSSSTANGDGELNIRQLKKWIVLLYRKKISFVIWSLTDKNESSAMLVPGADTYNWAESELTTSGKLALSLIQDNRFYNKIEISRISGIALIMSLIAVFFAKRLRRMFQLYVTSKTK